ncbi:ABC transporter ATP-binding protein [Magnetospirillum fulvum]|nr:ABC transporter ATP-binding protein [Magnetospirillum fulvum]
MTSHSKSSLIRTIINLNSLLTARLRLRMAWFVIISLISSATELFGIGLILAFIQSLSTQGRNGIIDRIAPYLPQIPIDSPYQTQVSLVVFLFAAYAVRMIIGLYYAGLRLRVSWELQKSLMNDFFIGTLTQPYIQRARLNSSDLANHLTATIARVARALQGVMSILTEGTLLVSLMIFLFIQKPYVTLTIIFAFTLVNVCIHTITRRIVLRNGKRETVVYARYLRLVLDSLNGFKEITIYGRSKNYINLHNDYLNEKAEITLSNRYALEFPRYVVETLSIYIILSILMVYLLNNAQTAVFAETILLFAVTVARILPSANKILSSTSDISSCQNAIEVTLQDREKLHTPMHDASPLPLSPFSREIRLDHVGLRYPGAERPVLRDISLCIHKGEMIGIIGANGSGKTTLIETIIGLLPCDSGTLSVDDTVITPAHARAWQDQIGYVSQECWLMDDTVGANIAFGRPYEETKVEAAARRACLHDFIQTLPNGYDTSIGERGQLLSGGQRQRIGIARALYENPALLILDEATSALDPLIELEICKEIEALVGDYTILVVAHRLNTLTACDRTLFMRDGSIVVDGSLEQAKAGFQDSNL